MTAMWGHRLHGQKFLFAGAAAELGFVPLESPQVKIAAVGSGHSGGELSIFVVKAVAARGASQTALSALTQQVLPSLSGGASSSGATAAMFQVGASILAHASGAGLALALINMGRGIDAAALGGALGTGMSAAVSGGLVAAVGLGQTLAQASPKLTAMGLGQGLTVGGALGRLELVIRWYTHPSHALPVVVDLEGSPQVLLADAHEILIDESLQGVDQLTFIIPSSLPIGLQLGSLVDLAGRIYRVTIIRELEDNAGLRRVEIEAWALWYDLAKMPKLPAQDWVGVTVAEILPILLDDTKWTPYQVVATSRRSLWWAGGCNRLEALRELERIFQVEVVWNTLVRTVSVQLAGGEDSGLHALRGKNLRKFEIETSAVDLVHRLYPRGKDGLTIAEVNQGIPYLEVSSPYNPPPSAVLVADDLTTPQSLMEFAMREFATLQIPRICYSCSIVDLSGPHGDAERLRLGDRVTVYDEDSGHHLTSRVVRLRNYVLEPWRSEIELATTQRTLRENVGELDRRVTRLEPQVDTIAQDLTHLSVHNLLRNSRANDGLLHWAVSGWEADIEQGVSGLTSFRAKGQLTTTYTLVQVVTPVHRQDYIFSAWARSNVRVEPSGSASVEIIVRYTDGSSDRRWTALVPGGE